MGQLTLLHVMAIVTSKSFQVLQSWLSIVFLIETMNQFYRGEDETSGNHEDAFWEFFQRSKYFQVEFDTKAKAVTFYRHFRCGILHQAQTKKLSKLRIGMPSMVQLSVPNKPNKGLIIDRRKFHAALLDEINDYTQRLRNPVINDDFAVRRSFRSKMDCIAG